MPAKHPCSAGNSVRRGPSSYNWPPVKGTQSSTLENTVSSYRFATSDLGPLRGTVLGGLVGFFLEFGITVEFIAHSAVLDRPGATPDDTLLHSARLPTWGVAHLADEKSV